MPSLNKTLVDKVRAYLRTQVVVPNPKAALRDVERLLKLPDQEGHGRELFEKHARPTGIQELAHLGDGIIAVHDTNNEWSAYFDAKKWRAHPPYDSNGLDLFPPGFRGRGIGVLYGKTITNLPLTDAIARECLEPTKVSTGFYNQPIRE